MSAATDAWQAASSHCSSGAAGQHDDDDGVVRSLAEVFSFAVSPPSAASPARSWQSCGRARAGSSLCDDALLEADTPPRSPPADSAAEHDWCRGGSCDVDDDDLDKLTAAARATLLDEQEEHADVEELAAALGAYKRRLDARAGAKVLAALRMFDAVVARMQRNHEAQLAAMQTHLDAALRAATPRNNC